MTPTSVDVSISISGRIYHVPPSCENTYLTYISVVGKTRVAWGGLGNDNYRGPADLKNFRTNDGGNLRLCLFIKAVLDTFQYTIGKFAKF